MEVKMLSFIPTSMVNSLYPVLNAMLEPHWYSAKYIIHPAPLLVIQTSRNHALNSGRSKGKCTSSCRRMVWYKNSMQPL